MKKLLLTFSFATCLFISVSAQQPEMPATYRIEVQGISETNLLQATSLLTQLSGAKTISYDSKISLFTLTTDRVLDQNIIAGKMQKNFFPVTKFQKAGETPVSFPVMKNTGNPEADAAAYELEKSNWISENPDAYQQMINNPAVSNPKN